MPGTTEARRPVLPVTELSVTARTPALTPRGEDALTLENQALGTHAPGPHALTSRQTDGKPSPFNRAHQA
ncbi:hypothetical protein ACVWZX_001312 [Deinococcus sp. UYEF24]